MSLIETKKITADTTRKEIEDVIEVYKKQVIDLNYDLEEGHVSDLATSLIEREKESIQNNVTQLEAILVKFYEAKCELCDHHQKMDFRTMKFICGRHDRDGKEVILQW